MNADDEPPVEWEGWVSVRLVIQRYEAGWVIGVERVVEADGASTVHPLIGPFADRVRAEHIAATRIQPMLEKTLRALPGMVVFNESQLN